jgi:hypothetical protein
MLSIKSWPHSSSQVVIWKLVVHSMSFTRQNDPFGTSRAAIVDDEVEILGSGSAAALTREVKEGECC